MSADAGAVDQLLDRARAAGQFSAAAWAAGTAEGPALAGQVGVAADGEDRPIGSDALFDLASVTKPIVGLVILRLVQQGVIRLETRVSDVLTDWPDTAMARADLRALLTHTSGAPGPTPLWREHADRDGLLAAVARLRFGPAGEWCYSSMGFITLGLVAEAAAGRPLDVLVAEEITGPVGMSRTSYGPVDPDRAVATEDCPWRGRVVRGTVHDENAEVLGGVAGHAGLFAPVADVGRLGTALLRGDLLEGNLHRAMTGADDGKPLGWWPREHSSYLAAGVSDWAYAHTGFTGTSLVVDPEVGRWYCLLTNRVHPTREARGFEAVRTDFHSLLAEPSQS